MTTLKRVMIFDPEPDHRGALEQVLELSGFETQGFSDAERFLEKVRMDPTGVDIAIIDSTRVAENGYHIERQLQALAPHTRAILTSAYNIKVESELYRGSGFIAFAQKPNYVEAILDILAELTR